MSLRSKPLNPAPKEITVSELFGQFRIKGFNAAGFPVGIKTEDDGTLRSQLILHDGTVQTRGRSETNGSLITSLYGKNAGTLTAVFVESTGQLGASLYGHDGSALQRLKTETSRELAMTTYFKTSTPAVVAGRADAAGFQRVREFESWEGSPDVTAINTTATTIYTVPASTTSVVEIEISNTDTVANTFDFHIVPSGGAAAIGNRMRTGTSIAAGGFARLGPYHVDAGVFFQALVTTVGAANGDLNAIAVVREFGTGDAVALV